MYRYNPIQSNTIQNKRTRDQQVLSAILSATNRYNHLLATAKKRMPNSLPSSSIAESFCSFLSGKITSLRLSLYSLISESTSDSPQTHLPLLMTLPFPTSSVTKYFPTNIRDRNISSVTTS